MDLQSYTPMHYVRGMATRTHKRDDHYPICSKWHYGCLLPLCGPTMDVATLWPHYQVAVLYTEKLAF